MKHTRVTRETRTWRTHEDNYKSLGYVARWLIYNIFFALSRGEGITCQFLSTVQYSLTWEYNSFGEKIATTSMHRAHTFFLYTYQDTTCADFEPLYMHRLPINILRDSKLFLQLINCRAKNIHMCIRICISVRIRYMQSSTATHSS